MTYLEKIIAKLKDLKIIPEDKLTELKALESIEQDPTPVIDPNKVTDKDLKELFSSFNTKISALEAVNKNLGETLAAEKAARDAAVKIQEGELNNKKKADAEKLVDEAIKAGKIKPEEKEKYVAKAVADFETMKEAIERFAIDPHFKNPEGTPAGKKTELPKDRSILAGAPQGIMEAMAKMDGQK